MVRIACFTSKTFLCLDCCFTSFSSLKPYINGPLKLLIQCIKFSFSLTAGARFRWTKNKSVPHSSSVFACRWGKNTRAPSIVYRLLIGWNCHTTWSQGNLHYRRLHSVTLFVVCYTAVFKQQLCSRLHFLKLDREFFCLQPSLAQLYSAAASPSERLRSDGSLAISLRASYDGFLFNTWEQCQKERRTANVCSWQCFECLHVTR